MKNLKYKLLHCAACLVITCSLASMMIIGFMYENLVDEIPGLNFFILLGSACIAFPLGLLGNKYYKEDD